MKLVVYTAIFGSIHDQLREIKGAPDNGSVGYHAYVDGVTEPTPHHTGWELRPAVWEHATNPRLRARRHKLLSHQLYPEMEYTLWVDGCLTPIQNPWDLVELYFKRPQHLFLFRHMQRNCVYQECEACIRLRKDAPAILRAVSSRYKQEGYPHNNGLAETTAVLRKHTDEVKKFNEAWWEELRANSVRDQISFDYMMWKLGMEYGKLQGVRTECPHFKWRPHR